MKTKEQKAKAYDEALERAKNLYKDAIDRREYIRAKLCEIIFPELKESEDERIRKWLIDWAKAVNWSEQFTVTKEQVLAWLEKQDGKYSGGTSKEFAKIKEAGYDWNVAKKKLEKIHKPLYEVGNIIGYKSHYYYIKEVVKNEERGFHYNLIAVDGGEIISIGPAGEKDIILISNNHFDYEHANIQQNDFAPKASFANRQLYNRAILTILSNYVEKYPDIRFGQMLFNLDIKPHFDEESRETYWNLCKTINKQKL